MGWLAQDKLDSIVERTRNGGAEIVGLLKTGSAFMLLLPRRSPWRKAISKTERILPCAAYLSGEYGVEGSRSPLSLERGVERIVELDLNESEKAGFDHSIAAVKGLIEACQKLAA